VLCLFYALEFLIAIIAAYTAWSAYDIPAPEFPPGNVHCQHHNGQHASAGASAVP